MIESTEIVTVVRVSTLLVEQLSEEWSRPMQVRIQKRTDHGDCYELEIICRVVEAASAVAVPGIEPGSSRKP